MDDLVRLYRDDDNGRARFLGGPEDGVTKPIPTDPPPPLLRFPIVPDLASLVELEVLLRPVTSRSAVYELMLDELWLPCRADDGDFLYAYKGER